MFASRSGVTNPKPKATQQDVVIGDVVSVDFGDVAINRLLAAKIDHIGALCVAVPFAGEYTFAANIFKRQPDAAVPANKSINLTSALGLVAG